MADRSGTYRHAGYRVKVVDTIGAGDAFTAGMVHAYLRQASLAQISDVANRCGSYVASQPGATPGFPEQLLDSIRETLSPKAQKKAGISTRYLARLFFVSVRASARCTNNELEPN